MNSPQSNTQSSGQYVVVARRYRPQGFEDLVGQGMVSQALCNAINSDRVGHAYLFTGARGVGKTSTARILSKALNCEKGPTPTPCHECDICQTIASGDDVDVLEIDGASNRGIDEIRQLRSNINMRPSRSKYKIYIIDEVHMLTKEAFNALLKTLEEPPGHVKFIFCTTDPEKIPITVLSRCQRFDFSPVSGDEIVDRLKHIVASEGAEADEEALRVLARKAAGSVRDSQSLLEQLMSFTSDRITLDAVHSMLGTAGTQRLHGVLRALAGRNPAQALQELDLAIGEGVDAGQLAEQMIGCIRDLLALSVGGSKELMLHSAEADAEELTTIAKDWGTPNLLAAAQIVDEALGRMRLVTHSRVLLEMALIRIANLEDLQALSEIITQLGGASVEGAKKKTAEVAASSTPSPAAAKPSAAQPEPGSESVHRMDSPDTAKPSPKTQAAPKPAGSAVDSPSSVPQPHIESSGIAATVAASTAATTKTKPSAITTPEAATGSADEPQTETAQTETAQAPAPPTEQPVAPTESKPDDKTTAEPADTEPTETGQIGTEAGGGEVSAETIWKQTVAALEGLASDFASHFEHAANSAPNRLVVTFPGRYTASKAFCERPEKLSEMERIASGIAGRKLKLEFRVKAGDQSHQAVQPRRAVSARQRERDALQHPFVQRALEVFSGDITSVTPPRQK